MWARPHRRSAACRRHRRYHLWHPDGGTRKWASRPLGVLSNTTGCHRKGRRRSRCSRTCVWHRPMGQSDGGATAAELSLAWKQSLPLNRASASSLRALNPVAHSRAPCGHHVVVHDDMAATAGSGASREWFFQLLLVRGTSLHASCVRLGAPRAEQAEERCSQRQQSEV